MSVEVEAVLRGRIEASRAKDLGRLMSYFAPGIVYYDVVPPLRFVGTEAVAKNFQRWFDGYDGPISLETKDLTVAVDGDVAWAHMLHLDSGTRTDGMRSAMWVRSTVCLRRVEGTWLVTHEHISMPIDPATMGVWLAPVE
ncbi:YybH family protein [Phytomonospora endophytica]|uniref:Ketosteroid isomerase-like protein n=1 Tax=Phytomonospora endophytica TaxID=714109 RepID=A0A841FK62_9ACTN|nr:nuclear transport factor 2 family protein [Phytomonospora endophytica]MBB6036264.1 ketosteroid isomerase-like protein [Phytomonospora endophytica]GIG67171.1 ketosteroid isomerase [Phytomonospora endophytica]